MLVRQTLLFLPAQVLGPVTQLIAALVWTYWLAPAPYGVLTFIVASQDLVFLLCLSWWSQYTLRYFGGLAAVERANFRSSEPPVFALAFGAQLVCTILILLVLREPFSLSLAASSVAFVGSRTLLQNLCERARTESRIAIYTIGQLGTFGLGFGFALAAVALVSPTPEAALWGFALAQALTLGCLWRLLGLTRGTFRLQGRILHSALTYGLPLVAAGALSWFGQNGIRIIIERVAGIEAMGLIAVGWGLGQRLAATLAMVVIAASFPLAVRRLQDGSREAAYSQLAAGGVLLMGLIVPASLGLAVLAGPLVATLVAEPFRPMTTAFLPFAAAAGAVRNIRIHVADPVFLLIERPRMSILINAIDVAAVLSGCLVGLLSSGLVGAVVGCLAGATVGTVTGFVLAHRLGGFVFPFADGLRVVGAGTLMAGALMAMPWSRLALAPPLRLLLESVLGAGIYSTAILVLCPALQHQVPRELVRALRRLNVVSTL